MYAQARTLGTTAPSFVPAWPLPLRCGGGCGQSSEPWARDFPLGDAVDGVEAGQPPDAVEAAAVHAVGAHHARAAILHHRLARHLARHRSSFESRTQPQGSHLIGRDSGFADGGLVHLRPRRVRPHPPRTGLTRRATRPAARGRCAWHGCSDVARRANGAGWRLRAPRHMSVGRNAKPPSQRGPGASRSPTVGALYSPFGAHFQNQQLRLLARTLHSYLGVSASGESVDSRQTS